LDRYRPRGAGFLFSARERIEQDTVISLIRAAAIGLSAPVLLESLANTFRQSGNL